MNDLPPGDRNREPLGSVAGFDFVAVARVGAGVLNVVEEDEFIDGADEVEITFPWNVV